MSGQAERSASCGAGTLLLRGGASGEGTRVRLRQGVVFMTAGAVLVGGWAGLARRLDSVAPLCPTASPGAEADEVDGHGGVRHDGMDEPVTTGRTCNQVESVSPVESTYVPDIAAASAADRAKAQRLLDGVNMFCDTHSAAVLESSWRSGAAHPSDPTHLFNPDPTSRGLDPANPRAALVYDGELGGVMFTGAPLPSLGSIPRAHFHDMSRAEPVEMLHVYCTTNLEEAFTPSRRLGVKADSRALRLRIGPSLVGPTEAQLRAVRAKVRGYAGGQLLVVPVEASASGGPDPVMQGLRTEIRRSLTLLSEPQLRSVWTLMRSYGARVA